jgi:septal ring factor EnvC (AmiA/AmiB activator)
MSVVKYKNRLNDSNKKISDKGPEKKKKKKKKKRRTTKLTKLLLAISSPFCGLVQKLSLYRS